MPTELNNIRDAAVQTLIDGINSLIIGANADIAEFANAIVADGIQAAAEGKFELLPILADQTKVLAEKQRLQVVAAGEAMAAKIVWTVLAFASKLVIPTLPTI